MQSYFKPHVQMFDMGRWERRPFMNMLIDATEGTCNEVCRAQVILAAGWRAFPLMSCDMQAILLLHHVHSTSCWVAEQFPTPGNEQHANLTVIADLLTPQCPSCFARACRLQSSSLTACCDKLRHLLPWHGLLQ